MAFLVLPPPPPPSQSWASRHLCPREHWSWSRCDLQCHQDQAQEGRGDEAIAGPKPPSHYSPRVFCQETWQADLRTRSELKQSLARPLQGHCTICFMLVNALIPIKEHLNNYKAHIKIIINTLSMALTLVLHNPLEEKNSDTKKKHLF